METLKEEAARAGTVTKLAVQDNNPERISVYLDGAYALGIHQNLVVDFQLARGRYLSEEEVRHLAQAEKGLRTFDRALAFVSGRSRTVREIKNKLVTAGFEAGVIDSTLRKLETMGLVDDVTFAREYAAARFNNKRYGPGRIRIELIRKGIGTELAEQVVEEAFQDIDTLEEALRAAEKRRPVLEREPDLRKRWRKLFDYLVRRGHDVSVAGEVVDRFRRSA